MKRRIKDLTFESIKIYKRSLQKHCSVSIDGNAIPQLCSYSNSVSLHYFR